MITSLTQLWAVEYTSLGGLKRTSYFIGAKQASEWEEFLNKSEPGSATCYVSNVSFTVVAGAST